MKRRSPRKSIAARSTPKSARTTKVATKTPRTATKRARKSTVVPGASLVDKPRIAPATAKKNKQPSTSKLKTPKSRGQRGRPHTKDVDVDGDDGGGASIMSGHNCIDLNTLLLLPVHTSTNHLIYAHLSCNGIYLDMDAAPPPDSTTPSRPHPAMRPKSFADRLADARAYLCNTDIPITSSPLYIAVNSTSGHFPPDPSNVAPGPSPPQVTREKGMGKGKGKGKTTSTRSASTIKSSVVARRQRDNGNARERAVQSTAVDLGHETSSPGGGRAALRVPRADGSDDSDHSDLPLAQKLAKTAPTDARPKSRKKTGTKDARPPPARKKRTATKAKADTKLTADADVDEPTKRTAKSAVARTSGTTVHEAAAGREASAKSRKRGAEEQREHEGTASPVTPPRGREDVPDVAPPPTKRARVLQEKNAPRKRKERAKDVEDGNTANIENENGPPAKKPRAATAIRYVITALPQLVLQGALYVSYVHLILGRPSLAGFRPSISYSPFLVAHSFFLCVQS